MKGLNRIHCHSNIPGSPSYYKQDLNINFH